MLRTMLLALAASAMLMMSCSGPESVPVEPVEESAPAPFAVQPVVEMADQDAAIQLDSGFHGLEGESWRWTAKAFSVTLGITPDFVQRGAKLTVRMSIPDTEIEKLGPMTLSARVGETPLDPETYSEPGDHTYERLVPGDLLIGDSIRVYFELDKALAPGEVDQRELGVIVSSIGLTAQ